MKKIIILFIVFLCGMTAFSVAAQGVQAKKKILYVDSYHAGYPWSAGITAGVRNVLQGHDDVELKITRMDTKRNPSEEFRKSAALQVKALIDSWQPDLVIASDDNASQYLIKPYFKDAPLPFIFCGVNWDASEYGFPCSNVTGMIEVQLIDQIIATLKPYAHGERIAFLKGDDYSARKEAALFEKRFGIHLDSRFVTDFPGWKEQYQRLQREADMILLGNAVSISGWDERAAKNIVRTFTKVPTGNWDSWMAPYSLLTLATVPEEQGEWAARAALTVLQGMSPQEIPIVTNKKARVYLNMGLAKALSIKFPRQLVEDAHLIGDDQKKILFVNSYHKGYAWSDEIEKGFLKALRITERPDGSFDNSQNELSLKIYRMDTKFKQSVAQVKEAALAAKAIIDEWHPDVVLVSDDNATKYLLSSYYLNSNIPFVYCGVNWEAGEYGLPTKNTTGIVEVAPALETIAMLRQYAKGGRLGYIGVNTLSERKNIENFTRQLGIHFADGALVDDYEQWQVEYKRLQGAVDMLLWFNPIGIKGWSDSAAEAFILANTTIPTGGTSDNHVRFALLGRVKIAEEQGWWAGKTALRILDGVSPAAIPPSRNKESRLYLNMVLAKKMGIKFPMELIEESTFLNENRL